MFINYNIWRARRLPGQRTNKKKTKDATEIKFPFRILDEFVFQIALFYLDPGIYFKLFPVIFPVEARNDESREKEESKCEPEVPPFFIFKVIVQKKNVSYNKAVKRGNKFP